MNIDENDILENDSFCMSPWIHLNLWPNGEIHPCCISNEVCGSVHNNSIEEIWNSNEMKRIRKDMLNGVKRDGCSACYADEKISYHSRRKILNEDYKKYFDVVKRTNPDGSLDECNLLHWDLRFSNKCNFSCIMCGPEFSSTWEKESNIPTKRKIDFNSFDQQISHCYSSVEEVYFAGGEPLIMDEHYHILDKLIELGRTDVKLLYSTNFSTLKYKDKNVLDYWKQFPNLNVYASIDGIGKRGEIIRKGFNWERFIRNVKEFYEKIPEGNIYVSCTYQALNSLHIIDLHQFLYENQIIKDIDNFHVNFLKSPEYFSVQVLPREFKKFLIHKIKDYIENYLKKNGSKYVAKSFVSMIKHIISHELEKTHLQNFVFHTKKIDLVRNEDCREIFPEFEEYIWVYYY